MISKSAFTQAIQDNHRDVRWLTDEKRKLMEKSITLAGNDVGRRLGSGLTLIFEQIAMQSGRTTIIPLKVYLDNLAVSMDEYVQLWVVPGTEEIIKLNVGYIRLGEFFGTESNTLSIQFQYGAAEAVKHTCHSDWHPFIVGMEEALNEFFPKEEWSVYCGALNSDGIATLTIAPKK